jgi:3-phenylpropionate/cinnamic acid dioxygenase small subunit
MSDVGVVIDKQAITEVCYRYAKALDDGDWETLRTCFAPDVRVTWPNMPTFASYDDMEAVCRDVEHRMTATQHLVTNVMVVVAGDDAESTSYFQTTVYKTGTPGGDTFTVGCTCHDRLVRTDEGWKVRERSMDLVWADGNRALALE